jgi:hypothetical protein
LSLSSQHIEAKELARIRTIICVHASKTASESEVIINQENAHFLGGFSAGVKTAKNTPGPCADIYSILAQKSTATIGRRASILAYMQLPKMPPLQYLIIHLLFAGKKTGVELRRELQALAKELPSLFRKRRR